MSLEKPRVKCPVCGLLSDIDELMKREVDSRIRIVQRNMRRRFELVDLTDTDLESLRRAKRYMSDALQKALSELEKS